VEHVPGTGLSGDRNTLQVIHQKEIQEELQLQVALGWRWRWSRMQLELDATPTDGGNGGAWIF
jgi:hypothetical protein